MKVRVLYFAALREARGCREEEVEVPVGTTLGDLYASLFPGDRVPVAYAVNQVYAAASEAPSDGDEVCFLPPLGGG